MNQTMLFKSPRLFRSFLSDSAFHSRCFSVKTIRFLPYDQAGEFVRAAGITSSWTFNKWCRERQRPEFIPSHPEDVYRNSGWQGYRQWLGLPLKVESTRRSRDRPVAVDARGNLERGIQARKDFIRFLINSRPDFEILTLPVGLNASHLLRKKTAAELEGFVFEDSSFLEKRWIAISLRFASVYLHNADIHRFKPTSLQDAGIVLLSDDGGVFAKRRNELPSNILNQTLQVSEFKPRESVLATLDEWCSTGPHRSEPEWMVRIAGSPSSSSWKHAGWRLRRKYLNTIGIPFRFIGDPLDIATGIIGEGEEKKRIILRTASAEKSCFKFSLKFSRGGARQGRMSALTEDADFDYLVVIIPKLRHLPSTQSGNSVDESSILYGDGGLFMFPKTFLVSKGMLSSPDGASGTTTMYIIPPGSGQRRTLFSAERQDRQRPYFAENPDEFLALWQKLSANENLQQLLVEAEHTDNLIPTSLPIETESPCTTDLSSRFLAFEEARDYARDLKLDSCRAWKEWSRTSRPSNIPSHPNTVYQNLGWISWYDFLGKSESSSKAHSCYLPYDEAKDIVRSFNMESPSCREWNVLWRSKAFPPGMPGRPDIVYQKCGSWVSWYDFLGYSPRQKKNYPIREPLPTGSHHQKIRHGRRVCGELMDFISEGRPNFKVVPLPHGFHANCLFAIVDSSGKNQSSPTSFSSSKPPESDEWVPLRLRFSRSYAYNTDMHMLKLRSYRGDSEIATIVISDEGKIIRVPPNAHHGDGFKNLSFRSDDFRNINEIFEILETVWNNSPRRSVEAWMNNLCFNPPRQTWMLSAERLRSSYLDPLGIRSEVAKDLDHFATFIAGGRRCILRTATRCSTSELRFQFTICKGVKHSGRKPLSHEDAFDLLIVSIPSSSVDNTQSPPSFFLFPKEFAIDEGWLETEEQPGRMTNKLHVPDYIVSSRVASCLGKGNSQFEIAKQRQECFYVSNIGEFEALWNRLGDVIGFVGGQNGSSTHHDMEPDIGSFAGGRV